MYFNEHEDKQQRYVVCDLLLLLCEHFKAMLAQYTQNVPGPKLSYLAKYERI
jgi:hypothetical protein